MGRLCYHTSIILSWWAYCSSASAPALGYPLFPSTDTRVVAVVLRDKVLRSTHNSQALRSVSSWLKFADLQSRQMPLIYGPHHDTGASSHLNLTVKLPLYQSAWLCTLAASPLSLRLPPVLQIARSHHWHDHGSLFAPRAVRRLIGAAWVP